MLIGALALLAPAAALAQCDLDAKFGGVANPTFVTGQPSSLSVRFSNVATTGDCAANQVRLRPTGTNVVVAPTAFRSLPALAPNGVALLTFQVEATLPGTYVYEVEYATSHKDANDTNHRPKHTVTFTAPSLTLAGPTLVVTSVDPVDRLRVGRCNTVNVTVKNSSGVLLKASQVVLRVHGPVPGRALVSTHTVDLATLVGGESRTIPVPSVSVPSAGSWRLVATASATGTNQANNTLGITADDVSRPCQP